MPALITSREYAATFEELCKEHPRLADLVDAIEWALLQLDIASCDHEDFPLITDGPKGPVRGFSSKTIPPGIVVVFGFEEYDGERKVLLLDMFIPSASLDD